MAEQRIENILRPAAGENVVYTVEPETALNLNFDLNDAVMEVKDGNLLITLPDGSTILLEGIVSAAADEALSPMITDSTGNSFPAHPLLMSLGVTEEDFATAAGGTGAGTAAGSGSGEYGDDAGVLWNGFSALGRVDVGFDPNARPWIHSPGAENFYANLGIGVGEGGVAPFMQLGNYNESDGGFYLTLQLDRPAAANITITLEVSGSAAILEALGVYNEYRSDISLANGIGVSYDPATHLLTIIIPQGIQRVDVPVKLVDDHISDGDKSVTFTVKEVDGPIMNITGQTATANISEDNLAGDADGVSEHAELDGPVVSIHATAPEHLYEGGADKNFSFALNLQDPHNPAQNYNGYKGNGLMSQDMAIVLNIGGQATPGASGGSASADYHLQISPELMKLVNAGQVRFDPAISEENGLYVLKVPANGQVTVTLTGQVDANGHVNSLPAFNLADIGLLQLNGVMHINGDSGAQGEGAENVVVGIASVSGNESQVGKGASASVNLEADPVLSLKVTTVNEDGQKMVNESEPGFNVQLHFDKPIAPGVEFTIVLSMNGSTADIFTGADGDQYKADFFLPGYPNSFNEATNSTTVQINGVDVTFTLNPDGTITVTGDAKAFDQNGNLNVTFPLNDDHRDEINETVNFGIKEVSLNDGTYAGTVGAGSGDGITISEDTLRADDDETPEKGELDGPIVSIHNAGPVSLYEGEYTSETGYANNLIDTFIFKVDLTDPHVGGNYMGYTAPGKGQPDGVLSEAMSITIALPQGADYATYGQDYTMYLPQEVLAAGVGFSVAPDGNGNYILTLDLPAGYDLSKLGELRIEAKVNPDALKEGMEKIDLSLIGTKGNESLPSTDTDGTDINVEIAPDAQINMVLEGKDVQESGGNTVSAVLTMDKPVAFDTVAQVRMSGETLLDVNPLTGGHDYEADMFIPSGYTAYDTAAGGYQPNTYQVVDNGDGTFDVIFNVEFKAGSTAPTNPLNFLVNDDHLTEGTEEGFNFTVDKIISHRDGDWKDGPVVGAETGGQGLGQNDSGVISDDRLADNNLDGPVFGVTLGDHTSKTGSLEEYTGTEEGRMTVNINLFAPGYNPANPSYYQGYDSPQGAAGDWDAMSQTTKTTITLDVNGMDFGVYTSKADAAANGADFWLDMSSLDSLASQGVSYALTLDNGKLVVTLTLPEGLALSNANLNSLNFDVRMVNDDVSERGAQSIKVSISTDGQNESRVDGTDATITVKEGQLTGPVISLDTTQTTYESKYLDPGKTPADHLDPEQARDHNTATHTIHLSKAGQEDIAIEVTLGGGNAARFTGAGQPTDATWGAADYAWAGNVMVNIPVNGQPNWVAITTPVTYDPATGVAGIVIPKGAVDVRFDVAINDDLRESEGKETYNVDLKLVVTDADGNLPGSPNYDANTAMPDGEAILGNNTTKVTINEDTRTDRGPNGEGDNLNPYTFDGPWVHLSANQTDIYETAGTNQPNLVTYTVSLTTPSKDHDSGVAYMADEAVTVTLKISGVETFNLQYGNNFKLGDMELDVRGYNASTKTGTLYDANGDKVGTFVYNPADDSASITTTVAKGASEFKFTLKANDDPLQGVKHDAPEEDFSLSITGVKGNEARVHEDDRGPATVTINNDSTAPTYEGVQVGLAWTAASLANMEDGNLKESNNYDLNIKFYHKGSEWSASNNPYNPYTGNVLPDDMTIKMNFDPSDYNGANAADGRDLHFTSNGLKGLMEAGKISITVDGTTYSLANNNINVFDFGDIKGDLTITLIGGKFTVNDTASLKVTAVVHGDNINEWDANTTYLDSDKGGEFVGVKITEVNGNEAHLAPNTKLETNITDQADGQLTWGDASGGYNGTGWDYSIKVSYPNSPEQATPGDASTALPYPGETVHLQVNVANSGSMQQGEEFKLSAYDLFLSMNGLTEAASPITRADYNSASLADLQGNPALADLALAQLNPANINGGWDSQDADASATFDLYVPPSYWANNGGKISFTIEQGDHTGVNPAYAADGFKVSLIDPYEGKADGETPEFDMKGEIVGVDPNVITPTLDGYINVSLTHTNPRINEDPDMTAGKSNFDTYTVHFTQFGQYLPTTGNTDFEAGANITFEMILTAKSAKFDSDTTDNYMPHNVLDFAVGDKDGNVFEYQGLTGGDNSLVSVLNGYLATQYGYQDAPANTMPYVQIDNIVDKGNGVLVFEFAIKEGFPLNDGVGITFVALDDNLSENAETFNVRISNVNSYNEQQGPDVDVLNIGIDNRYGTTQSGQTAIDDDYSSNTHMNGFALAAGDVAGSEGSRSGVDVPIYAFILSNGSIPHAVFEGGQWVQDGFVADGKVANINDLQLLYNSTYLSDASVHGGNPLSFMGFVQEYFKPTQPIQVNFNLNKDNDGKDGYATVAEDYVSKSTQTINAGTWEAKVDGNGNIYFESKVNVQVINDYIQEGDEKLDFAISTVPNSGNNGGTGNESRPVNPNEVDGFSTNAQITIKDFHDGPTLVSFGPVTGVIVEPIDSKHDGTDHEAAPKLNHFGLTLDGAVSEPVAVWLSLEAGGAIMGATGNTDYFLGKGIYLYNADGTVTEYSYDKATGQYSEVSKPLAEFWADHAAEFGSSTVPAYFTANPGSYFTVVATDKAAVEFEVWVKDDNDTANGRGIDVTGEEGINFTITDMQGGEVRYTYEDAYGQHTAPWNEDASFYYNYTENGVSHKVYVDQAAGTWHDVTTGAKGDLADNPSWYTVDNGFEYKGGHTQIIDDGFGPVVSMTGYTWEKGGDPMLHLNIADFTGETVTVSISIYNMDGSLLKTVNYSFDATSTDGALTASANLAQLLGGTKMPGGSYLQISGIEGGEAQGNSTPMLVYGPGESEPVPFFDNFVDNAVNEGEYLHSYDLDLVVPDGAELKGGKVTFTLNTLNGSAGEGSDFTADGLTITIQGKPLKAMKDAGEDSFHINITAGDDGEPVVTVTVNGVEYVSTTPNVNIKIEGKMPEAINDNVAEGDEHFHTIITNASEFVKDGISTTTIHDKTYVTVIFVDKDGNVVGDPNHPGFPEDAGTVELTAILVVANADGSVKEPSGPGSYEQATSKYPLEFELEYPGSGSNKANEGEDFSGQKSIYFPAGESEASVKVQVTNDDITEGTETFKITAHIDKDALSDAFGDDFSERFPKEDYATGDIAIHDDMSGPEIAWTAQTTSVNEGSALTVDLVAWKDGIRQVVEEQVEITFRIDPKNGMSLDDLDGFSIGNGAMVSVAQAMSNAGSGNFPQLVVVNAGQPNEYWELKVDMDTGKALESFKIHTHQDVISDSGESFTLTMIGTLGGETAPMSTATGNPIAINEVSNGPVLQLQPGVGNETDNTVDFTIKLNAPANSMPTEEESTITLTLDAYAKDRLDQGESISITLPDGNGGVKTVTVGVDNGFSYDASTGKLTITLPEGVKGGAGQEVKITFPIKDDSLAGDDFFKVTLEKPVGGEVTRSQDVPGYNSEFIAETAPMAGKHGGSNTFSLEVDDSLANIVGATSFVISNVPKGAVDAAGAIVVNDANGNPIAITYSVAADGKITVNLPGNTPLAEYEVTVTYSKDATAAQLSQAKANIAVTGSIDIEYSATVTIKDETNPDLMDGPTVNLVMADTVDEGDPLSGTVVLDMGALAGDMIGVSSGGRTVLDDISITMQYSGSQNPDGSWNPITLNGMDANYYSITGPDADGLITINVLKGAPVPDNGKVDINFNVAVKDNVVADNPDFTLTIADITGNGVYEAYKVGDNSSQAVTITDNTPSVNEVVSVTLTVPSSINEGAASSGFNLKIAMPDGMADSGKLMAPMVVTLDLSTDPAGMYGTANPVSGLPAGWTSNWNASTGQLNITVPSGTSYANNAISGNFNVKMPDNSLATNPDLNISISNVNDGGVYEGINTVNPAGAVAVNSDAAAKYSGPAIGIALDQATVTEDAAITGHLNFTLPTGKVNPSFVPEDMQLQIQVGQNPDGSYTAVAWNNLPAGISVAGPVDGLYTISIAANTPVSSINAVTFGCTAPNDSLASSQFTMGISSTGGGYETVNTTPLAVTLTNDASTASGPAWDVVADAATVAEGAAINFTVSSTGAAWNDVAAGQTVRVFLTIDGLVAGDVVAGATLVQGNQYYVDMVKGDSPVVSVTTANNPLQQDARAISLSVVGDNTFEQNTGATSANVTITDTGNDGVSLSLAAQLSQQPNQIDYSLSLALIGTYFAANPSVVTPGSEVTFNLNTTGFSADQLASAKASLLTAGLDVADSADAGVLVVTIPADYNYSTGGTVNFSVTADPTLPAEHLYTASISDAQGALETLQIAASPLPVQMNLVVEGTAGNDSLYGGAGDDAISGGAGSDAISGGAGNDVISGGQGSDTLSGGEGSDTFVWGAGDMAAEAGQDLDTITDFEADKDTIDLSGLLGALEDGDYTLHTQQDGGILIDILNGGASYQQILVQGNNLTEAAVQDSIVDGVAPTTPFVGASLLNVLSTEVDNNAMDNMLNNILGPTEQQVARAGAGSNVPDAGLGENGNQVDELQQNLQNQNDILLGNN